MSNSPNAVKMLLAWVMVMIIFVFVAVEALVASIFGKWEIDQRFSDMSNRVTKRSRLVYALCPVLEGVISVKGLASHTAAGNDRGPYSRV